MAIRFRKDVPNENLVGLFICSPSLRFDQEYGWPARVVSTTKARMSFVRLSRGEWDPVAAEWQVCPTTEEAEAHREMKQCKLSSVELVCDTAHEAIALFRHSVATGKAIEAYRKRWLADVRQKALAGELPVPPYFAYIAGIM